MAPRVSHTMAQNMYSLPTNPLSYFACFVLCAYDSQGFSCFALLNRGLVIATSIANPLPSDHTGLVTSPGRLPDVGPRMPFFPAIGESIPSDAILSTRSRSVL